MNHGEGHPCEHAALQCDRASKDAVAAQIVRFDNAMVLLAGDISDGDVEPMIKEAASAMSILYEGAKGSWCNCRVASWYHSSLVQLQRHAIRYWGELKGREKVPVNWEPL
jgi:hypothetical protein